MAQSKPLDNFIRSLEERAKELKCLYKVEEILSQPDLDLNEIFLGIIKSIPLGCQYPSYCDARIIFNSSVYEAEAFKASEWFYKSDIKVQDEIVGTVEIYYLIELPESDQGPFLKEEIKLFDTIADRIGHFILHKRLKTFFNQLSEKRSELEGNARPEWSVILEMLANTDHHLYSIISKKMINSLFFRGVKESKELFMRLGSLPDSDEEINGEQNRPSKKKVLENSYQLGEEIFELAAKHLSDEEILTIIQKWIFEDKSAFLLKALANPNTPLTEVADSVRKYHHMSSRAEENSPIIKNIRVSLIRRFLTDQLNYIHVAKDYTSIIDFYNLFQRMVFPSESHGKVGGKSSGLLLALNILSKTEEKNDFEWDVKIPKTWYIPSDGLSNFIYYNNLEDVMEQKYKDLDQVKQEYPYIIQVFKNSSFAPEIVNGLSRALDDFADSPIIVRSSSLLEDRMGTVFAGKYKSLFLANQGSKQERLDQLMDAIAEVYASVFSPDPIAYRYEHGLIDFNEEMGIMIQEVVGQKIGKYYFPAFAGVAFSNNEFRWSSRIKREDGLLRLVPGLGTRAVDRVGDDYPVLVSPGQPDLRVNLSTEEVVRYAPKYMDVINLESNSFDTISLESALKEVGDQYPSINDVFSIYDGSYLKKPVGIGIDTKKDDIIVTFENLLGNTKFLKQFHTMLQVLNEKLATPVDLEFAFCGKDLFLLQCRPQSYTSENVSAVIPKDLPYEKLVFSANKYVTNGKIPDISHVVYVHPKNYDRLSELDDMKDVGKVVGKLNAILPKKKFILMGPGRWGSRDSVKLGVKVSYNDINNTALLIEIARKKGSYVPDLSFGTHFFQDLVEAQIKYLPLYPDEEGNLFNESFFRSSQNVLNELLEGYNHLSDVIRVIDVSKTAPGKVLRIVMSSDEEKALAYLDDPLADVSYKGPSGSSDQTSTTSPWQWRLQIVERIADAIETTKYGVKKLYVLKSSVQETARGKADIDLIVHIDQDNELKSELETWFDGWSKALSEVNYQRTGYRVENFLDVKFVTDFDFENNTKIIQKLNSNKDHAIELKIDRN